MKACLKKKMSVCFIVAVTLSFLLSVNASAQIAPFLSTDGNYNYTYDSGSGTGSLTFSSVNPTWATYTNDESGCAYPPWMNVCDNQDAIISTDSYGGGTLTSEISFGSLTNTSDSPSLFGSASLSVYESSTGDVFFSATIDDLDTNSTWNTLSNITAGTAPASRYVDELLANGQGYGALSLSFTPNGGGTETFTANSSGSLGVSLAAAVVPEPVSTILFVTGGATLALGRFRKKRN